MGLGARGPRRTRTIPIDGVEPRGLASLGSRVNTHIMSDFVLASRSPRRRSLLASVGLSPEVIASDVDERPLAGEDPVAYGRRIARAKVEACVDRRPVLGADTVVALGNLILTKAADEEEAKAMLRQLSAKTHQVHTAVALRPSTDADVDVSVVTTEVEFRALTDSEIARYVATREPMDKAGAYGIQGQGGALVRTVNGSYTNVVGLPLTECLAMLSKVGVQPC